MAIRSETKKSGSDPTGWLPETYKTTIVDPKTGAKGEGLGRDPEESRERAEERFRNNRLENESEKKK